MKIQALIENNNKFKLVGPIKILNKLRKDIALKNPNAFHVRRFMPRGWDGLQHYLTEAGYVKMGLYPWVVEWCNKESVELEPLDERPELIKPQLPKKVGNLKPRPYQSEAVKSVITNSIHGINFPMGVLDCATNAGKTIMMAMIYLAYQRKESCIVLLNDGNLYNQFLKEIPELIGEEDFGYIRSKDIKPNKFTIAMVQTLSTNIQNFKHILAKFSIVCVDEADLADNKTYKTVLNQLYNAKVRVGLSGSIYMSKLKKDAVKNRNLEAIFSKVLFTITKQEMVELGHSTKIVVKIVRGNLEGKLPGDWQKEYETFISQNIRRAHRSADRTERNIRMKRLPALIVCQFHKHIELMHMIYRERFPDLMIESVHHKTKGREKILENFRVGKIDILISSFIVKRGQNFPLIRYLQNAAGSDSQETISQIVGRMERKHESKKIGYIDDLYDEGKYLSKHSRHRIAYYKKQGWKIVNKI